MFEYDVSKCGAMLTGSEIKKAIIEGSIYIDGFTEDNLNPNSYNIAISNRYGIPKLNRHLNGAQANRLSPIQLDPIRVRAGIDVFDTREPVETEIKPIPPEGLLLVPNQLYLIPTAGRIATNRYIPKIAGRSSAGRFGISVYQAANFGDIGFNGALTLQVSVIHPTVIYPNQTLCQVYFITPHGETDIQYTGQYNYSDSLVGPKPIK